MRFLVLEWDDIVKLSLKLGQIIKSSGYNPHCIVALLRGGVIPARILSDFLGIDKMYTLGVAFYTDVAKHARRPTITQPLNVDMSGNDVLIVDDVADTGSSLILARETIMGLGARSVRVATLHKKPWSEYTPDFYVDETDAWIVYPWEYYEVLESLSHRVQKSTNSSERRILNETIERIRELLDKYWGIS